MDEPVKPVTWKDLSGEERYRVVEMALKGEVEVSQLCKSFGVSRQTLHRVMDKVQQAAVEALTPKKRGRKPTPASEAQAAELVSKNTRLEEQLDHWKTKYDIARTMLDLERKVSRGETLPGEVEKKRQRNRRKRKKRPNTK